MNRNAESHFALTPRARIGRSKFDRSYGLSTTANAGDVVPIFWEECLPGDTFSLDTSKVIRMQTPIAPIFGSLFADFYYFFVPNRLVWSNWKYFMGEQKESPWLDETQYTPPTVSAPSETGWEKGTIADYFGLPLGVPKDEVNCFMFRSYAKIIEDWFRDENLQTPVSIDTGDTDIAGSNGSNYITDLVKGGKPFVAAKYHDYFTSLLPAPQRGPAVEIGSVVGDTFPVVGNGYGLGLTNGTVSGSMATSQASSGSGNQSMKMYYDTATSSYKFEEVGEIGTGLTPSANQVIGVPTQEQLGANLEYSGLVGVTGATGVTVNDLRMAFQMQKFYENLALGGSRYIELIKSMFGVDSPDARLQRSEYLGGNRVPIVINQVVQTSATQSESGLTTTPQGTVAAYSLTSDRHSDFTYSCTEHGHIIGVMVIRYPHVYQQGTERMWKRKERFDYYWPLFSHIGSQPVFNYQIYTQGPDAINPDTEKPYDEEVFGYSEAWADYRFRNSIVTGEMRSNIANSLDVWHLADDYESMPFLSADWIKEDKSNVDRVLTVTSAVADQFKIDMYFKEIATRPMPVYSTPGLIDHF